MFRRCTAPGFCPNAVAIDGRCRDHRRHQRATVNRRRGNWWTVYGPTWPARRLDFLARHPACDLCGRAATVADHYPVGIHELNAAGVGDPHADNRLRPLCESCHNRHTGRTTPVGARRGDRA